ncbi:anthranilate synthase component II [Desulfatiglans anilini]|uniref:anthranilate synthase component II n=1 Tax=Desulfatiglans anilini TaxID=90728 RepID=UPI000482B119|nr:aminodeoxychorismate/anthranilate synthase component II [Desulfatiglans anilini]
MLVLIDNYDSFTYNLVQMIEGMGREVAVYRNDAVTPEAVEGLAPEAVLISPGPGSPEGAGICVELIRGLGPRVPVLGICLGHQAIAAAFGGEVVRAGRMMHGKTSPVFHDGRSLYRGLPAPFPAARYHSLLVRRESLPETLEVSAWTEEGEIMGLRHREYRCEGIQFHPESIMTAAGCRIIDNFLRNNGGRNDD